MLNICNWKYNTLRIRSSVQWWSAQLECIREVWLFIQVPGSKISLLVYLSFFLSIYPATYLSYVIKLSSNHVSIMYQSSIFVKQWITWPSSIHHLYFYLYHLSSIYYLSIICKVFLSPALSHRPLPNNHSEA